MIDLAKARRNMVDCQVCTADVTDRALLAAMDRVERERFLPGAARPLAYLDRQIDVGEGRVLPTPMVLARLIQALGLRPGDRVLDIACGLGYSTALLAELGCEAVGLESRTALAAEASTRLAAAGFGATIAAAPLGEPPAGPFNAILVNGAVDDIPAAWVAVLAEGGRLACVRGQGRVGRATLATRANGVLADRILFDAAAPPLGELTPKPVFAF